MASNIHEHYGRMLKTTKLADVLDALHVTPDAAGRLTKPSWDAFAPIAQVPAPGIEPEHVTVELLKAREAMREVVARTVVDGLVAQRSAA
jgi:hypothetical protein